MQVNYDSWEPHPNIPRKPISLFFQVRSKASCPTETGHIWTALFGILNSGAKEKKQLGLSHQHSSNFANWAVTNLEPSTDSAVAEFLVVYTAVFLTSWWIRSAVSQKWFMIWGINKILCSVVWALRGNVHHYIPAEVCQLLCCPWEEHSVFCHRKELILKESNFLWILDISRSNGQKPSL